MARAYMITNFNLNTDIDLGYLLEKREIYFSKEDLIRYIKELIELFYEEYIERTNSNISFNDFYNKFNLDIEVKSVSLQKKYISDEGSHYEYLARVKHCVTENELEEFLLSYVDTCEFHYDYNFKLTETYTNILNGYKQYAFSYKALFPEKYHVEKYKVGDKVIYFGEEYKILKCFKDKISIFESDDPLNYLYGYVLGTDDGYVLNDDRFCYFPVDEDLISV